MNTRKVAILIVAKGETYLQMARNCEQTARKFGWTGDVLIEKPLESPLTMLLHKPLITAMWLDKYDGIITCDSDVLFTGNPANLIREDGRMWFGRGRKVPGANGGVGYIPASCRVFMELWAYHCLAEGPKYPYDEQGWLNALAEKGELPLALYDAEQIQYPQYGEQRTERTIAVHGAGVTIADRKAMLEQLFEELTQ